MYASAYTADTEWNDTAWKTAKPANKSTSLLSWRVFGNRRKPRQGPYWRSAEDPAGYGGASSANVGQLHSWSSKKAGAMMKMLQPWQADRWQLAERWWFSLIPVFD